MLSYDSMQPRDYQNELYEQALKQNTIVALSTGAGKTFISAMLLRELHTSGKYSVFLAPTRPLARQQSEYLKTHCQLRITLICGAETGAVNRFQESFWNVIVASSDVLVMTPAFFNDALGHNFLRFADITVLVIDECHRAVSRSSKHSHPYTIMLEQYRHLYSERRSVPRILGLTGSVTNSSLNKVADLRRAISDLETILCAKVATATNLQTTAAHADVQLFVYEQEFPVKAAQSLNIEVARFERLQGQKIALRKFIADVQTSFTSSPTNQNGSGTQSEHEKSNLELRASVGRMLANVTSALDQLGTFACALMLSRLARTVRTVLRTNMDAVKRKTLVQTLLHVRNLLAFVHRELLVAFNFDPFVRSPTSTQNGGASKCTEAWRMHFHEWLVLFGSPKLSRLLAVLQDEFACNKPTNAAVATNTNDNGRISCESFGANDVPSCLIFVEQRTYACLVARLLSFVATNFEAASLSSMRVDFVVGHGALAYNRCLDVTARMLAHKQMASVAAFRSGAVNTLVCTSVLEEGFDVPRCNLVVEFDFPGEFRRFVQAKGRARARDARFVVLISREKESNQKSCLNLYSALEMQLFKECQVHARDAEPNRVSPDINEAAIEQSSDNTCTGSECAKLTSNNVLTILERYCAQLPRDSYTPCTPCFKFETQPNTGRGIVRCRLQLPVSSSLGVDFVSNWCANERLAKRDAAFKACQALLDHNELDRKHLTPLKHVEGVERTSELPDVIDDDEADLACLDDLEIRKFASGSARKPGTRGFQRYHPLHRPTLLVGACPTANEPCYVYELVYECKSSDTYSLPNFALLSRAQLPEVPPFPLFPESGVRLTLRLRRMPCCAKLSTDELDVCISFHRVLFESVLNITLSERLRFACGEAPLGLLVVALRADSQRQPQPELDLAAMQRLVTDAIGHRNGWRSAIDVSPSKSHFEFDPDAFSDALVRRGYAKHEHFSKIVYASKIDRSRIPASLMDSTGGMSFAQYLERTYQVQVTCPHQPMLDCTNGQIEGNLNLLIDRWGGDVASSKRRKLDTATPRAIYLVPELCEVHIARASWYRAARLLPAALYRIENLLKSQELLNIILQRVAPNSTCASDQQQSHSCFESVSSLRSLPNGSHESLPVCLCRMMQATTTKATIDMFDLELLETVGDSFLKWATSNYLFLSFPRSNEGKLTSLRGSYISNLSLLKRGFRKRLPGFISNRYFEISVGFNQNWLPPLYSPSDYSTQRFVDVANEPIVTPDTLTRPVATLAQENLEIRRQYSTLKNWLSVLPNSQLNGASCIDCGEPNEFAVQLVSDKTVADTAESIIGYILLALGEDAARNCLQWLQLPVSNMDITREFLSTLMPRTDEATQVAELLTRSGFETRIGYHFNDKLLLAQAFTHASFGLPSLGSYERLEFVGDALLDYLITRELLRRTAGQPVTPGQLTDMRSALVNNNTFARVAVNNQYHRMLLHKSAALYADVDRYQSFFKALLRQDYEAEAECDDDEDGEFNTLLADPLTALFFLDPADSDADGLHTSSASNGQLARSSPEIHAGNPSDELDYLDEQLFGNPQPSSSMTFENPQDTQIDMEVEPPKVLGDIFESLAGAIFLDSGGSMETVWRIYGTLMHDEIDYCCKRRPRNAIREVYERLSVRRGNFELSDIQRDGHVVNRALPTKRCRLTVAWKESKQTMEGDFQPVCDKVFFGDGFDSQSARKAAARAALKHYYGNQYCHRDFV